MRQTIVCMNVTFTAAYITLQETTKKCACEMKIETKKAEKQWALQDA